MARRSAEQTRTHVLQRDTKNRLVRANQPEETTTNNLVRQLGFGGRNLGVRALLHTRPLEGGRTHKGVVKRKPSGADLELAIEVAPQIWFDFLLQAKSFRPSVGTYEHWSPKQNQHLISWAKKHNRIPGMLLYNDFVVPFVKKVGTTTDYTCTVFGGCASVERVQVERWGQTEYCHGPKATPAGISMCLDKQLMSTRPAHLTAIKKYHFQIEHLLHIREHNDAIDGQGVALTALSRPTPPGWAADLLNAADPGTSDAGAIYRVDDGEPQNTPPDFSARASLVIPFAGDGRQGSSLAASTTSLQ